MRKIIDLTKEYTEDELEEFMCDFGSLYGEGAGKVP